MRLTVTESKRGCGYRKEGGFYLMLPEFSFASCGKLPLSLHVCPACGQGVKFSRGWTWINGKALFQGKSCVLRPREYGEEDCHCVLNDPPDRMGLIWIGEAFYKEPGDWLEEALALGISRRVKAIPRGFELGKTWVAVAHIKCIPAVDGKDRPGPGIFHVFKPSRIDYIQKPGDTEEFLSKLEEKGITIIEKIIRDEGQLPLTFGRSPALEALSDIKTLDEIEKSLSKIL